MTRLFRPDRTYPALQAFPRRRKSRLWVPPGTSGPPVPVPFLNDTFTAANGTLVTARSSDSGATWAGQSGLAGAYTIESNRAWCNTTGVLVANAAPASADYEVAGQVYFASVVSSTSFGIAGRCSNAANTAYIAFLYHNGSSWALFLSLYIGGSYGNFWTLAIPGAAPNVGETHELKMKFVGNVISVYWDGVLVNAYTDTTNYIPAAGFPGLFSGAETSTTGIHVDSITAT